MDTGITYDQIRSQIGFNAGWGRNPSSWDADADPESKSDAANACIVSGLRRVLHGTVAPGTRKVYEWSFLRRRHEFVTVQGQGDYPLPGDFQSPEGRLVFVQDFYTPVPFGNDAFILEMRSRDPDATGVVEWAATRYKPGQGAAPQEQELVLWPLPSSEWQMLMTYNISADPLSKTNQIAPGGPAHAETIRLACLAEAASQIGPVDQYPMFESQFQAALLASISTDSRTRGPLGYNGDGCARVGEDYWPMRGEYRVSHGGTFYDNT